MKISPDINRESLLLERFNRRDNAAFGEIYSLFYSELVHFTTKLYTGTEVIPSDVIHDIFVNMWQSDKHKFENLINIKAYIYISIKNSFKNYVRHQKYIDKYRNDILYNSDYFVVEIVESEVYSLVNHAIDLLPSDCANILKLYIDGWNIKDISTFLNKSQRVVYNRKNEAIEILKKKMSCDKLDTIVVFFVYTFFLNSVIFFSYVLVALSQKLLF